MSNGGPRGQGSGQRAQREHNVWDCGTPNVARIYDYYLGGKDNYPSDREAARKVLGAAPDVPLAALENPGIPAAGNTILGYRSTRQPVS